MKKLESIPTTKEINNILDIIWKKYGDTTYEEAGKFEIKYGIKGDLKIFQKLISKMNDSHIKNSGIRMQKRLKRFYNQFVSKQSLFTINKILWLLNKHILNEDTNISIHDVKHEKIQKKRREWKVLRDQADAALKIYKEEKGNYYKIFKNASNE